MKTLLIIDVQNDFCPGGALAVNDGDAVVPVINAIQPHFDLVIATQDWHPSDHKSFASQWGKTPGEFVELGGAPQILWPDHCVQGTRGAELVEGLDGSYISRVFHKGTDSEVDSYSGFFDNHHAHATGLGDYLKEMGAGKVYVCGLATDYCVKFTAIDARSLGFDTFLIEDACRGVELNGGDIDRAVKEMQSAGVTVVHSSRFRE